MGHFKTIIFDINNQIARITLNRPEHANAMNMEFIEELLLAAQACDKEATAGNIRAVLISSTGNIFCAGGDISAFASFNDNIAEAIGRLANHLHEATSLFVRMKVPVIVAVNGAAAGAGFSLAVIGDLVLAAQSATFTMAYTAVGLSPDGAATFNLPRIIGTRRAQELILTNRRLSADEALQWGLVTKVLPDDQLMAEAEALAVKMAKGPTKAFAAVKYLLNASDNQTIESQMALEERNLSTLSASVDGREGVRAFLEKRKPLFTGK